MFSPIFIAIIYTVAAGIMNGSFALPTKHSHPWNFENIWLHFAFWSFLVIPWLFIFILAPNILDVYQSVPLTSVMIVIVGGFLFGIGQVCFAWALSMIGFGLAFVINIGLGTGLGFLLPLVILHSHQILSPIGVATLIGIIFIIVGLLMSYFAGKQRDKQNQTAQMTTDAASIKSNYQLGVGLAVIAGLFSAGQNFTFALTGNMQQLALAAGVHSLAAAIIIWPLFLTCSFIPYFAYMFYLHIKNDSFRHYRESFFLRNASLAIIMGILWYGSLVLYSKASLLIGNLGPVIAWPLFMVLIILTSNFWGWRHKEWEGCNPAVKRNALLAMGALIVAVIILAYSAMLSA